MRKFARLIRGNESGLTLIELIAAISIMSMAFITIYGVVHFGFNAYNKIQIENSLRDEGDLLMSTIISQLYDKGAESVQQTSDGILLKGLDNGLYAIQIQDGQLKVDGSTPSEIETRSKLKDDSAIRLVCRPASSQCGSGQIEIKLHLYQTYGGREQDMELDSRFGF